MPEVWPHPPIRACALCARTASPLSPVTVLVGNINDRNTEWGGGGGGGGGGGLGMRVQLALQSLEFYLPAGFTSTCRPSSCEDLESNVPTNATLRKWEVFRPWNLTSFMLEKSMQWTCSR